MTALAAGLRALVAEAPDAPAVTDDDRTVTRAELDTLTDRLAREFAARGVGLGDFVSIGLPSGIEHVAASVAAWKLGAVPQPLSHRLPPAELAALLELADPPLVVGLEPADGRAWLPPGFVPTAPAGPLPDVEGPSWKAPTSGGSTGRPKLIVSGWPGSLEGVRDRADGLRITRDGTMVVTAPLYHNAPYMFSLIALMQGQHVVLMGRFDAGRALALVERHHATWLYVVPTMMGRILRLPDPRGHDLSSLRTVMHVGAPCPPHVKRGWIDLVGPDVLVELYAGTESQASAMIDGHAWLAHPGSVGQVTRGRMKICDAAGDEVAPGVVGEVWMRPDGPPTYRYVGARPRERDGWDSLGDMGHIDADGWLYLADRRTNMILVGGANVYPAEVEAALAEHPSVRDSAVVGRPDEDYGQVVHAIVHLDGPLDADALRAHLATRLAPYKIPRTFAASPVPLRDDAGKIRRSVL